ncbi:SAM-dependent methyltransferase [Salinilacihabitans rarus]|uniref:SAM-dependent methyltransferase n=1 Tax=Salinilacihabitans rarus TaxID=2961596 RepID=UPI0021149138|nr:SAM-dependent methyltransferase [Salinilacihabitans rarus]
MSEHLCDIYVVGTGMVGTRQLTREVELAFESSSEVYLLDHQPEIMRRHLDSFDAEVTDLRELYDEGGLRENSYEAMAETVLDAAEASDEPVTLALYGHPFVFVSPSRWIVEKAPERGLCVEKRPGVSSMDCLYADLPLDPAANGVQMYEATDLLLHEYDLEPRAPAMIWQIGIVETLRYTEADHRPERFSRIRRYLQRFYPDDHEVHLLQTATYPFTESRRLTFALSEFEAMSDEINAVQTLYVPRVPEKEVVNEALADRVASADHLETITRGRADESG